MNPKLEIQDVPISGHAQHIVLRHYRPTFEKRMLPIILYFHGGGFTDGDLDEAHQQASALAEATPAWVISVGYSLAPSHPFPAATEDAYLALAWAVDNARHFKADARRVAVAGHEAGGNIANGLAAMCRDRSRGPRDATVGALALVAPLLDPSLTRIATASGTDAMHLDAVAAARRYRQWLPRSALLVHPYAAPLESCRLGGMPPTLIVTAGNDPFRVEGESYAGKLIAAGVRTEATRHHGMCHRDLIRHPQAVDEVADFFRRLL